jgi:4-amino-4-deoxy-L-arabinose transferase-like glycosyltransferase
MHALTSIKSWYTKELSRFEKLLLAPLILTALLLGILNLIVIIFTAPHNWDSMTYHLARVAYYLQHDNLNYFDANYWAQVIHPKNSSLLLLYTYLISGRNENLTQLVQFIAYWVAICGVYAISIKAGNNKTQSIFAAMVGALLTEWLMEATTTQNDMILVAFSGAITYFLLAFRKTSKLKYLIWAALGIGLSLGTKSAYLLVLPSIGLVALYALFAPKLRSLLRNFAFFVACILVAISIFALPSGYMENYRNFGHPIGPDEVRKLHSFEGEPISYIAMNGTRNIIRYGFEFLSLV